MQCPWPCCACWNSSFVIVCLVIAIAIIQVGDWRHAVIFFIPLVLTLMRIATAHFSWSSSVLGIFGLPVFSYLLLRSKLRHARGTVAWKGRTYPGYGRHQTGFVMENHGLPDA